MTRDRLLILLVVAAHWLVAIVHLFIAAAVLPPPNDHVGWLAVVLITAGHLIVSVALLKLSDLFAGMVMLLFFLAAMCADLYEHFRHASSNSVFGVAGDWAAWFTASVAVLLALEILGCSFGVKLIGGRTGHKGLRQVVSPTV
jgi:hypothetical protein